MLKYRIVFLLCFLLPLVCRAQGNENLLLNGDFEQSRQGFIDMWYTDAYDKADEAVRFFLYNDDRHGGVNCLGIANLKANDAKVIQWVKVKADTYYKISGWIKTMDVTGGKVGANLSVIGTTKLAAHFIETDEQWQPLEFYGKTGMDQESLGIMARLGYFGSLVTGYAFFDDLVLQEVHIPPGDTVLDFGTDTYVRVEVRPGDEQTAEPDKEAQSGNGKEESGISHLLVISIVCLLIGAAAILLFLKVSDILKRKKNIVEQRRYERRKKKLTVIVKKVSRKGVKTESHVKSRDISLSGIFIITEDLSLYKIDENVELNIFLNRKTIVVTRAVVVRSEIIRDKEVLRRYGYGLQFINLTGSAYRMLDLFVHKKKKVTIKKNKRKSK